MKIPRFIKEFIWSFYLPRYKQLSEKRFRNSLKYMGTVLLIAFLISGVLHLPKVMLLKDTIESELSKFDTFTLSGNVTQTSALSIPTRNPVIAVDLNEEVKINKEFFVIDKDSVKYRVFTVKEIPREQLKEISNYKTQVSTFFGLVLLLMLPGIALLLYVRLWLKYFLLVLLMGTFFFIVLDLTRWKLRWKQMLNLAAHAITPIILLEVIAAFATTIFLVPFMKFVGVNIYLVSLAIYTGLMIFGIVGVHVGKPLPREIKKEERVEPSFTRLAEKTEPKEESKEDEDDDLPDFFKTKTEEKKPKKRVKRKKKRKVKRKKK